jgi:tetratricopeptide (TPR) repeat protein
MMRLIESTILVVGLAAMLAVSAVAQSNSVPPPGATKPETTGEETAPTKSNFELADDLDGLFAQLGRTRDAKRADRISTRIWKNWQQSDSRSVDLLTKWARSASGNRRFGVALDLLDQVVALRPNYAEGFNQRATLHFMMDNYGKSITDIERTLALEPRHFGALSGLAAIFEQLERKEDALETWYRVLSVYPAMIGGQDAVIRLEEDLAGSGI